MIIVVAGGHGAAGRTTVASSLALTLMQEGQRLGLAGRVAFADCDVEQSATDLMLNPRISGRIAVSLAVPRGNERCDGCGRCAQTCRFHAIALYKEQPVVFAELCCSCLHCLRQCPQGALDEESRPLGTIRMGRVGSMLWTGGTLDIGSYWPRPLIQRTLAVARRRPHDLLIVDGPAGTTPVALEAMRGGDVVLVVVEPSPMGLQALQRTVTVAREQLALPVVAFINKEGAISSEVDAYCERERIPIGGRLPLEKRIASSYARGVPLVADIPEYVSLFRALYAVLREEVTP